MPYRRLYRYAPSFTKAKSASDAAQVPVGNAPLTILKRGAWTQGTGNDNAGAGATITVHDRGEIVAGDTVLINVTGGSTRVVASVTATTIVLQAGGTGTFAWADGDRIISTSAQPTIFTDDVGAESVGSRSTDAQGNASFYLRKRVADLLITDGTTVRGAYDVEGETEPEELTPEDFGAARDGTTNDGPAFTAAVAYLKARGGGVLQLGAGTYRMVTGQTIDFAGLTIRGKGKGITTLKCNANVIPIFNVTATAQDFVVEEMTIDSTANIPTMFLIAAGALRTTVRSCTFLGGQDIFLDSGNDSLFADCEFYGATNLSTIYAGEASKRARCRNLKVRIEGTATQDYTFTIGGDTEGLRVSDCEVYAVTPAACTGLGVRLHKDSGTNPPRDTVFTACRFAPGYLGAADAVVIDNAEGAQFVGCSIADTRKGYTVNAGKAIKILGGSVVGAQQESVDINGGSHIRIVELDSSDCGQQTTNTYDHVNIAAGVDDVSMMGLNVGNFIRGSVNKGRYGVRIEAGASDRIQILGLRGVIGDLGTGWFDNNSTQASIDIGHNIEDGISTSFTHTAMPGGSDVSAQSAVGNNIGVKRLTGAETSISVLNVHTIIHTPSGNVTYTALTSATDGQELAIINRHATNTITLAHGVSFFLDGGTSKVLGVNDSIRLKYLQSENMWVQVAPLINNGT